MRVLGITLIVMIVGGCAASNRDRGAMSPAAPPETPALSVHQSPVREAVVTPRPVAPPVPVPAPAAPPPARPTTRPARSAIATPAPLKPLPLPAPPKPDDRQYLLQTPGNWWLRIDRDGGGAYGYGSSVEDRATFGAGTFDFNKLGQTLRQKISPDGILRDATKVTISPRKGEPTDGLIGDNRYIRPLFQTAKSHRQGDLAQLDRLESSFPILPAQ